MSKQAAEYAKKTFGISDAEIDAFMDATYIGFFESTEAYLDSLEEIEDRSLHLKYERKGDEIKGVHIFRHPSYWNAFDEKGFLKAA